MSTIYVIFSKLQNLLKNSTKMNSASAVKMKDKLSDYVLAIHSLIQLLMQYKRLVLLRF